jgi:peptidoglycan/LPS O-acetylase OafA/YrhL
VLARNGFLGVDLFFFVSGFCICYPFARARAEGRPRPALAEFVRRRALKIVPSYVLALGIFAVVYHARFADPGVELADLLAHLAFVHVWSHQSFGSFSGPLWTIGVEVQFYVLFALLVPQIERRPFAVYACFLAASVAYRGLIGRLGFDTDFFWLNQLPGVLDVFGAGLIGAFAFVTLRDRTNVTRARLAGAGAFAALLAVVAGFGWADAIARAAGDDAVHRWLNAWRVAFGPLLLAVTLGAALGSPALRKLAGWRAFGWLSVISYNVYLWNLEIIVGLQYAGLPAWAVFWAGAALTLGVGALLTYALERPIQRTGFRASAAAFGSFVRPLMRAAAPWWAQRELKGSG